MLAGAAKSINMTVHSSKNESASRIRRRIRSRIMLDWPINFVALCLLICLVGFEQPNSLWWVAFASELDDAAVDAELVSSITSKSPVPKEGAITKPPMTMNRILIKAGKRGLGGGLPGALAGVIQVLTLMWVRYVFLVCCAASCSYAHPLSVTFRPSHLQHCHQLPISLWRVLLPGSHNPNERRRHTSLLPRS